MTNEEAIKVMRWALNRLEGHHYITGDYGTADPSAKVNAFGMAIEALEKQIRMKPIKSCGSAIRYCEVWKCPNCGFRWSGGVVDFCYKCGQAIDWEVSE